ncbi:YceI family protein [Haloactinomyces albus]|uniref:Polyisoprenoid-binding protein YceI n=1 Tax=Haloactinomyces albus TaxID=1352928 RepID=A0AAE4CM35_9ACTN|nr:YceI family protein [Haloactinomyces albus]MDR7301976.1 polyisoprenoid-binding protein YceI [Haloactinomyces albus]
MTTTSEEVPVTATVASWAADLNHSSVTFRIRNFFGTVSGHFNLKQATVTYDESTPDATVGAIIDAASIDTGSEMRDGHVRGEGFLDTDTYPEITFRSTALRLDPGRETGELLGELTAHGVTRAVTLRLQQLGRGYYPLAEAEALVVAGETELDRNEFGVTQNMPWGEKTLLGNEISIRIELLLLPATEE